MEETTSDPDSMLVVMASLDGSTPVETLLIAIHLERSEAGAQHRLDTKQICDGNSGLSITTVWLELTGTTKN